MFAGGTGRYFTPTQANSGQRVILNFERIDTNAEVYVNGTDVGGHQGGYTPFSIDITNQIVWGQQNTIAVKCVHDVFTSAKQTSMQINYPASWVQAIGGIVGKVQLTYNPNVYIKTACINPNIAGNNLGVNLVVMNTQSQSQTLELYGMVSPWTSPSSGTNVDIQSLTLNPGSNSVQVTVPMPSNPTLWSPSNPYLYLETLQLKSGSTVVCSRQDRFGFRQFVAQNGALYLNGNKIRLYEGQMFEYDPICDQQIDVRDYLYDELLGLKSAGYNIVRATGMGAYPPVFYQVCDEMGMLVYNKWVWQDFGSNYAYNWSSFMPVNLSGIGEWIYQNYNNPSLVMYGLSNEFVQESSYLPYLTQAYNYAKGIDTSRPMTPSSVVSDGITEITSPFATDFVDAHDYRGMQGYYSWNYAEDYISTVQSQLNSLGMTGKPIICSESVYYSPDESHKTTQTSYVSAADYVNVVDTGGTGVLSPISFTRTIGVRAYLLPGGIPESGEVIGKRVIEAFRRGGILNGMGTFNSLGTETPLGQILYQPLFVCANIPATNVFAGQTFIPTLWVINDYTTAQNGLTVNINIVDSAGQYRVDRLGIGECAGKRQHIDSLPVVCSEQFGDRHIYLELESERRPNRLHEHLHILCARHNRQPDSPIHQQAGCGISPADQRHQPD